MKKLEKLKLSTSRFDILQESELRKITGGYGYGGSGEACSYTCVCGNGTKFHCSGTHEDLMDIVSTYCGSSDYVCHIQNCA